MTFDRMAVAITGGRDRWLTLAELEQLDALLFGTLYLEQYRRTQGTVETTGLEPAVVRHGDARGADKQAAVADDLAELAELRRQVAVLRDTAGEAELVAAFLERCGIALRRWNEAEVKQAAEVVRMLGEHGHQALVERVRWAAESHVRLGADLTERGRALIEQLDAMAATGGDKCAL